MCVSVSVFVFVLMCGGKRDVEFSAYLGEDRLARLHVQ